MQDNVVAATVQARSVQGVAFGSVKIGSSIILRENASKTQAAAILKAGTGTETAHEKLLIPFTDARKVALFIDTGPGTFDSRNVLFTKQLSGGGMTAEVSIVTGEIRRIDVIGSGGAIQTSLAVTQAITSTGPLGDLKLLSSAGIPDVTMPSGFGFMDTNGPVWGTVQTTAGDSGRTFTDGTGKLTGATTINTTQGISGRIIVRGTLISKVISQKDITGVIAAEGDIGVAQPNGSKLIRVGGIQSDGGRLSGNIAVLGNILGDIDANGLDGRVAVKGRPITGLAVTRQGILGKVRISGSITEGAAIASGGLLGDATGDTFLSAGSIKGILAAKGDINFSSSTKTTGAKIFENATGVNAAAIDALFTHGGQALGFDMTGLDLAGLAKILEDLAALKGQNGNLAGPVA